MIDQVSFLQNLTTRLEHHRVDEIALTSGRSNRACFNRMAFEPKYLSKSLRAALTGSRLKAMPEIFGWVTGAELLG
jgi:hypothetical protein